MKREHNDMDGEDGIEALLRQVGVRTEPSAAVAREVERAVHDEWRATVAQRKRRRRAVAFGIAASTALVVLVASWSLRFATPGSNIAVTIVRIDGAAQIQAAAADRSRSVSVGGSVAVGDVLTTDDATRIALAHGTGASMRIDRGSRIERVSPDRFRLSAGAIYIDAGPGAKKDELIIETLAGNVRHLGTQYQIRHSAAVAEVSIREGRVEIERSNGAVLASAGERVRINAAGEVERGAISTQDPSWDWAEATSPPFAIDDRTLAEFLEWAARETGRQVAYASPEVQRVAETLKLRGSIEGLDPDTALAAVLATSEFTRYESGDDVIGVRLAER